MSFLIGDANGSSRVESESPDGVIDSLLASPPESGEGDRIIWTGEGRLLAVVRFSAGRGTVIEP